MQERCSSTRQKLLVNTGKKLSDFYGVRCDDTFIENLIEDIFYGEKRNLWGEWAEMLITSEELVDAFLAYLETGVLERHFDATGDSQEIRFADSDLYPKLRRGCLLKLFG